MFFRHAETVVHDFYPDIDACRVHVDPDAAAFLGVVDGIGNQVAENTLQCQRVRRDFRQRVWGQVEGQGLAAGGGPGGEKVDDVCQQIVESESISAHGR